MFSPTYAFIERSAIQQFHGIEFDDVVHVDIDIVETNIAQKSMQCEFVARIEQVIQLLARFKICESRE